MRHMSEYRGREIAVTPREEAPMLWGALIEVWPPGTGWRTSRPRVVWFTQSAVSRDEVLTITPALEDEHGRCQEEQDRGGHERDRHTVLVGNLGASSLLGLTVRQRSGLWAAVEGPVLTYVHKGTDAGCRGRSLPGPALRHGG